MDITTVTSYRRARSRTELALGPGERILGGGTWLMSEPLPGTTGFVDITEMGWEPVEIVPDGVRIAATCTIAQLVAWARGTDPALPAPPAEWTALSIVPDAANALLASFKIWNTATVGGNICRAFAAAGMVSLAAALDGVAWIWRPDGSDRRIPVAELVTGDGEHSLEPGEVVRALELPAVALTATAELRKIALSELGRSAAVATGRRDRDGSTVFSVTAATSRPHVLRFAGIPTAAELRAAVEASPHYYSDPLGAADWRRAVSVVLCERIRTGLAGSPDPDAHAEGGTEDAS